ncbi:uncharacterized protein LOC6739343 [Drosophila simulans]|uniref:Uncharacterized protein n=1 Tax=Drosophila simulans TaxID=7240 RepID=A0A0J9R994_DROSI|nr:uncharacterized protein LOC6739343 [Drosophila simulans]KMY92249.1 uncharacterized protein Dsimw501_GD15277 [Drosophila simulans]
MNSTKALLSSRIVAFGLGSLVTRRGMKQLRLDEIHYKLSSNKERNHQRTWPQPQMQPEIEERMDDTKYRPGRWTERKFQATWREADIPNEETHKEVKDSRSQDERTHVRELRRTTDPNKRLQRIAMPATQFISQFISTQSKNKRRYVEAAADRMAIDGY